MDNSRFDQFKDPEDLIKPPSKDKAKPEVDDLESVAPKRDHTEEQAHKLLVLLKEKEKKLAATAKKTVEALYSQTRDAEDALIVAFVVGDCSTLRAGGLTSYPESKLNVMGLEDDDRLVALRISQSPLNPVFFVVCDNDPESASFRLRSQLRLFMKAWVEVPGSLIESFLRS